MPGPGPSSRLARLLGYAEADPTNVQLLADAVSTAIDEGQAEKAIDLIARYSRVGPLTPELVNLQGLAEMASNRFRSAADHFETLLASSGRDPVLLYNLAWCRARLGDYAGASALLDERVAAVVPQAAPLKVRSLHHLGELDEALAWGRGVGHSSADGDLMGALSAVAIDAEDLVLAEHYATRAGERPDALATLGMIRLNTEQIEPAMEKFEQALALNPADARAHLGRGLAMMLRSDPRDAAVELDRAASLFGSHLGSWLATGWAHFMAGDHAVARARFETALALDDTFAETHGSLAVLDVYRGDLESARRRTEVALRLDRRCNSAALSRSLILASEGDEVTANRVRELALNAPIAPGGRSIVQAMAALGLFGVRRDFS
jgi:tetratricopeptide (TPR) repeat protein